ncbi:MAG: PAS domain S-box protein, partial [Bryobacterales bacterium]|nr:PAS domain S-box protein [Bryobacterales bacterium]
MPGKTNQPWDGARDRWWQYGVAVCFVIAGLLLHFTLAGVLGSTLPYLTSFVAVIFAAWCGGLGPGLLATVLSAIGVLYFPVPLAFQIRTVTQEDALGAIRFIIVSILTSILIATLRRSRAASDLRARNMTLEASRRGLIEQELAESRREADRGRDLFQTTLASIGDAVIATDLEGRVTFLNRVAEDLTGWTRADAVGKLLAEVFVIITEEARLPAASPVERAIREANAVGVANRTILITKDGREILIEDSAAPIRNEGRHTLGAVLVFRDITERRKSEEALAGSEERLRLALESGQIGVWDWDVIKNRVEWSDRLYEIHAVERDTFETDMDEIAALTHPEDRERVSEATRAALQEGARYDIEYRVVPPNGGTIWLSTTALVFRNDRGEPTRMLGATTDITDRKQAEALRLQQWHTFDIALSNTPDFTYIFDLEGRFTYINRALLSLLQISLDEGVGKNFFDLNYPPDLAGRLQRQIQEVIDTREPLRDQTPFTDPTGETRYYEYIFVPVIAADGKVEAV